MISFFNRFIDWFLMRNEGAPVDIQSPAQLMDGLSDVNVLIADPDGKFASDEAKSALLQSILAPLNEKEGLSLRLCGQSFKPENTGSLTQRYEKVVQNGRDLLHKEKCDLLLWGIVELEEQAVRWHFLSAQEGEPNLGVPGIAESLVVPFAPEQATLDVLYGAIFAATQPSHSTQALKIGEYLLGAVDPLTKLPSGLSPRKTSQTARTSTMGMCAILLANIARRGEELGWFEPAIKAFENWNVMVEQDQAPLEWALVKNHEGWLYEVMADHDEDAIGHIETALNIFNSVSDVFTQQAHPLEWAAIQLRMAGTCASVGRKKTNPDYLSKAARYYKKSLDVYNQATYPLNWADVMTRMAKVLMLHGQMVKGAQSLEQAGVAFQAILKVYDEDKYPALWASTQNNLGATLFALAKRDPETTQWLDHAIICFEQARGYYEAQNKPKMVHVIDKNIARASTLRDQIEDEAQNDLLN